MQSTFTPSPNSPVSLHYNMSAKSRISSLTPGQAGEAPRLKFFKASSWRMLPLHLLFALLSQHPVMDQTQDNPNNHGKDILAHKGGGEETETQGSHYIQPTLKGRDAMHCLKARRWGVLGHLRGSLTTTLPFYSTRVTKEVKF